MNACGTCGSPTARHHVDGGYGGPVVMVCVQNPRHAVDGDPRPDIQREPMPDPVGAAVRGALEEYLVRAHGIHASATNDTQWFLDFLAERGHTVVSATGDE